MRQFNSGGEFSGKEMQMHCIICFYTPDKKLEPALFVVNGNSVCLLHATEPMAKHHGLNYHTQASSERGRELLVAMEQVAKEFETDLPDAALEGFYQLAKDDEI